MNGCTKVRFSQNSLDGASAVMQHARPSLFADVAASDRSLNDCSGSDSRLELGL